MYLCDTNVLSELPKPRPNAGVIGWLAGQDSITISAITVEELTFGVARAREPQRRKLRAWLDELLAVPPTIIPVDDAVARAAGELRATQERRGRKVAQADMLIAASALLTSRALVTRNARHFEGCGVTLLDPFS